MAKQDFLFNIYRAALGNKLDILEFNILINKYDIIKNNSLKIYKCSHFKLNKDLNIIKSDTKSKDLDQEKELLSNKLIRSDIYKKIIKDYELNKKIITIYNYYENILMFLFNKYKINFMHMDDFGLIKNNNNKENVLLNDINNKILYNDSISYINFLYDNSNNTFLDKTNVLKEFISILNIIYNKFTLTDISIKLIEKFINCKFINEQDKNELQFFYNSLIN